MLNMNEVRRIVVKVGTSTLTYANGKLNIGRIERLSRTISDLRNRGYEMVLVSSGAVGVGAAKLGLRERPRELAMKQAAAAVGQCELMHIYDKMFLEYGVNVAQILLTRENIIDDDQRRNIQNTFSALLRTGAVPIVNENDTVATAELTRIESFGDNDTLSAVVARICEADLLVIFSDIEGLYDADPRKNPQAKLIGHVSRIDAKIRRMAGGAGTANGTGGMATKLTAAELCMDADIPMLVASGEREGLLYDIVDGKPVGTLFARAHS
ncbi:MAG: glutamate 5-kinase [Agathobaculum sp.]|uniref:glutamate 5-kinase n=1 Tax=Agathobaculum sp. TaxID=2048138 RepID=UPI0025BEFFCE|nr:glutamate 5-kinase [Agathobaculum sp.]MCI7126644.1 glutamate 5-kinase [Agathobaculum sp.]MDY3711292.1 glutamate 5-kinase [Agathobaculum sp.]